MEIIFCFLSICIYLVLVFAFLIVNRSWYKKSIEMNSIWRDLIKKSNNDTYFELNKRIYKIEDEINLLKIKLKSEKNGDDSNDSSLQDDELPTE